MPLCNLYTITSAISPSVLELLSPGGSDIGPEVSTTREPSGLHLRVLIGSAPIL